jgi:hypothetical protein
VTTPTCGTIPSECTGGGPNPGYAACIDALATYKLAVTTMIQDCIAGLGVDLCATSSAAAIDSCVNMTVASVCVSTLTGATCGVLGQLYSGLDVTACGSEVEADGSITTATLLTCMSTNTATTNPNTRLANCLANN